MIAKSILDVVQIDLVQILPHHIAQSNERLNGKDQRFGGYLCVYRVQDSPECPPFLIIEIGEPVDEKRSKYFEFCQEKARRLLRNPSHLSSWQSRNVEQLQYGGAIRTTDFVLAFSGLVEKADEAVLVDAAFELDFLSPSSREAIARVSENDLIVV